MARYKILRIGSFVRIVDNTSEHFNKKGNIIDSKKNAAEKIPSKRIQKYCVKFEDGAKLWFIVTQLSGKYKIHPRLNSVVRVIDNTSPYINQQGVVVAKKQVKTQKSYTPVSTDVCVKCEDGIVAWFNSKQLLILKKNYDRQRYVGYGDVDFSKVQNILPTYVTVVEFAIIKECRPESMYNFIRKGAVKIITVGLTEDRVMIDLQAHKDSVYKKENETPEQRAMREAHIIKNWPKQLDLIRKLQDAGKI